MSSQFFLMQLNLCISTYGSVRKSTNNLLGFGVADYIIFFIAIYDIIFFNDHTLAIVTKMCGRLYHFLHYNIWHYLLQWSYTCNSDQNVFAEHDFVFTLWNLPPQNLMSHKGLALPIKLSLSPSSLSQACWTLYQHNEYGLTIPLYITILGRILMLWLAVRFVSYHSC
jgi:hypothetical protein